jgi:hypothetical protein
MNKAFVREPDNVDPYCPRCSALGEPVTKTTLVAQLGEAAAATLGDSAAFCPTPSCEVAYFDSLEVTVPVSALLTPRYPKDLTAPICPCFGLTLEDIDDDIADGKPTRIRELLAKSKSPAAHCATASPTGKCCLTEVQRIYFKRQAGKPS